MKREYKKTAKLDTTAGRYFIAKQKTKSKKEAAELIGYNPNNVSHLEDTKTYKEIEKKYYNAELLKKITLEDIANEHIKIIKQDKELGAKLQAISKALEKIEPQDTPIDQDAVIVVLKAKPKQEYIDATPKD
jgi:hypothetical protein